MVFGELPAHFIRIFSVVFGLIWGSFANVMIYRIPRGFSLIRPRSYCPACNHPIAAYDNIPIVSYLFRAGRARCCNTRISVRYPMVELICAGLSLAIEESILRSQGYDLPLSRAMALYTADFAFALSRSDHPRGSHPWDRNCLLARLDLWASPDRGRGRVYHGLAPILCVL